MAILSPSLPEAILSFSPASMWEVLAALLQILLHSYHHLQATPKKGWKRYSWVEVQQGCWTPSPWSVLPIELSLGLYKQRTSLRALLVALCIENHSISASVKLYKCYFSMLALLFGASSLSYTVDRGSGTQADPGHKPQITLYLG